MRKTRPRNKKTTGVRIIGGTWRGRRLPVADIEGLRPTGDRLRETLFNWLQPVIHGTHCLDLFAGSGALGFEAISRGAAAAVLIEQNTAAVRNLQQARDLLSTDAAVIHQGNALVLCQQPPAFSSAPFDLVFVDPPWTVNCLDQVLPALVDNDWLKPGCLIYVEMPKKQEIFSLPQLHEIKRKTAGEAQAILFSHKKIQKI